MRIEKCPCCDDTNVRKDFDYPRTMMCCDKCGADFDIFGEIILDPREFKYPKPRNETKINTLNS